MPDAETGCRAEKEEKREVRERWPAGQCHLENISPLSSQGSESPAPAHWLENLRINLQKIDQIKIIEPRLMIFEDSLIATQ